MKLEDLSLWQRIILAAAIVLAVILLLLGISRLVGSDADAQEQKVDFYQGIPLDATLLEMDKRGLKEAYHQQILHLWEIWLRGGASSEKEITAGLKNARRAYNIAAQLIAKREQELQQQGQPK